MGDGYHQLVALKPGDDTGHRDYTVVNKNKFKVGESFRNMMLLWMIYCCTLFNAPYIVVHKIIIFCMARNKNIN